MNLQYYSLGTIKILSTLYSSDNEVSIVYIRSEYILGSYCFNIAPGYTLLISLFLPIKKDIGIEYTPP